MGGQHLPVVVLQQVGPGAVEDTRLAQQQRRCVVAGGARPVAGGLHADEPYGVVHEGAPDAQRVAAGADAGHDGVGELAGGVQELGPGLLPDHRLEPLHHGRIGVRADGRAQQVVGGVGLGDPVADRFVDGVFEGCGALVDEAHLGSEQSHPLQVGGLPIGVDLAHVDHAVEAEERADRRGGDAVLSCTGVGDDPLLAEAAGEQTLCEAVVDLVGTGMGQVLAFDPHRHAVLRAEAAQAGERGRPAGEAGEQLVQLGDEGGIGWADS